MDHKVVVYLHGFASSGQGTKAQYFRRKFESGPQIKFEAFEFNPTPRDFEYMTITGLINRLRQYLLDYHHNKIYFIGSSLGALVALHYAHRFAGIERMLLLAPALTHVTGKYTEAEREQWRTKGEISIAHYAFEQEVPLRYDYHLDGGNYLEPVAPAAPVLIIHGRNDEVVPIEDSRRYVADYPDQTQLVEIDSDHRLNDQLDIVWDHVRLFLLSQ